MSRQIFERTVSVPISILYQERVPLSSGSFVLKLPVRAADKSGMLVVSNLQITYFGEANGAYFRVHSYSYNVQHLPKNIQDALNIDPDYTAMQGLGTIGIGTDNTNID